jgi:outer membrane protein OmpA-like peptidoglycan-associated protein
MRHSDVLGRAAPGLIASAMLLLSGCVATQDWVQTYVTEQLFPLNKRISDNEAGLTQVGGRVDKMASQIADLDSRLNQTTAKADRALDNLQHLKLERKLMLDLKQGAFFASNTTVLTAQAKKDIDSCLSDLKGDPDGTTSLLFVVAGYTDNVGGEKYNYELGRLRADNVATYLTTQKKVDPANLAVYSFGESSPIAENTTAAGRAKNRRVEILVYSQTVGVGSGGTEARSNTKAPQGPASR